jgi:hypothetical protein
VDIPKPEREEVKKTSSTPNSLVEAIQKLGVTLLRSLGNANSEIGTLADPREEELVKKSLHEMEYRKARALQMLRHQAVLCA